MIGWESLRHDGMVIAPGQLAERFSASPEHLPVWLEDKLRAAVTRVLDGDETHVPALIDLVLERVLELPDHEWRKANHVGKDWSCVTVDGKNVRPRRIWGPPGGEVAVFVVDDRALRVGQGKRTYAQVVEWLRQKGRVFAILTNGRQWRIVHAGPEHDASCQWDIAVWFVDGAASDQVTALRALLGRAALSPGVGVACPLAMAITASRASQGELSAALGERVRQAVEDLVQGCAAGLTTLPDGVTHRHLYVAATRIVMRLVVVLFAEARELLPVAHPVYDASYSVVGLRTQLVRQSAGRARRMRDQAHAWPRLRGLFSLVHDGSTHPDFGVPRYGGNLFAPGDKRSDDMLSRAVAALEAATPSDAVIHGILEKLSTTTIRIRAGRQSKVVSTPVNFKSLSSEYIGILYEGLLDYELRRADEFTVFLKVGNQPALPFARLDAMVEREMKDLLAALKKDAGTSGEGDEEAETPDEAPDETASDDTEDPDDEGIDEADEDAAALAAAAGDTARLDDEKIRIWARKAVRAAGIVKEKRGKAADDRAKADQEVQKAVKGLIGRQIHAGDWYLVRWGGTRKGAGTFYTRPQLAGPTVRRTLDPLLYEGTGADRVPRTPEAILSIKVCDPAMGSASFLVSALRSITDALYRSIVHHKGHILGSSTGTTIRLADALPLDHPSQETLPVPPEHEDFEERVKARLRRHVVERCLYGVDIDPLAVELGRLALWVETMDRSLPFSFLDHKLKGGNGLVGAWLDQFADYPIRAWDRDGGDGDHDRFVHHSHEVEIQRGKKKGQTEVRPDKWTSAILAGRDEARAQLAAGLDSTLFERLPDAGDAHASLREALAGLHAFSVHEADEQRAYYEEHFVKNPAYAQLKGRLDLWCALWFWPGEAVASAPGPGEFAAPSAEALAVVKKLATEHRFFHWEIEFPDVFSPDRAGFDAIVGNPPWETQKPNSKEFYSDVDPLFRTYGKQEANGHQRGYWEADARVEERWLRYLADFKARANWVRHAAFPFGDPKQGEELRLVRKEDASNDLHRRWRERRAERRGFADAAHPFRHQGSADLNTYKMFLELGHALLKTDGRLGLIVPSGAYSDLGSRELRELFLERCRWQWMYVFQNEKFVFVNVHHSFKMCVLTIVKGGVTTALHTRFRLGPGDSPTTAELETDITGDERYLALPVDQVSRFSPASLAILESRTAQDLAVMERIYGGSGLLGGPTSQWPVRFTREVDMTNDSSSFPPRARWERDGYRADEYGHWIRGDWQPGVAKQPGAVLGVDGQMVALDAICDVAVPLYQGVMIDHFGLAASTYESGAGNRAKWVEAPIGNHRVVPQFLMGLASLRAMELCQTAKVTVRGISRNINSRTVVSVVLDGLPAGNSLICFVPGNDNITGIAIEMLGTVVSSVVFDFQMRERLVGVNVNQFVMNDTAVPSPARCAPYLERIARFAFRLRARGSASAREWLQFGFDESRPWQSWWAVTRHERLRLRCILDAAVAALYDLDEADFRWILRDCDHPVANSNNDKFTRTLDPKGFWRVDKDEPPELRHPVLSLVAFRALKEVGGLDAFLNLNNGDGWALPDTIQLADHGLGQGDPRAEEEQPVGTSLALQPRYRADQEGLDAEASWAECRRHAHILERLWSLPLGQAAGGEGTPATSSAGARSTPAVGQTAESAGQPSLFPDKVAAKVEQLPLFGRR